MKILILSLTLLMVAIGANANEQQTITKEIKAEALLFGGTTADVTEHLDMAIRKKAIEACGSAEKIVGLLSYELNVSLNGFSDRSGQTVITVDIKTPDYNGPLMYSLIYPKGSATADVLCLK